MHRFASSCLAGVVLLGAASTALAEPVELGPGELDAVTAGKQDGAPFGLAVVVAVLRGGGTGNKGHVAGAAQRDDGSPGLGDTQTSQIQSPAIRGKAKAKGL